MTSAFLKKPWWQQVTLVVIACVLYIQLAGAIGTKLLVPLIGWSEGVEATGSLVVADSIAGRFARWDSGYYLQITQYGYRPDGAEREFFPLYPLTVQLVSTLTGLSLLWSGLLISIVCFLFACLYLYKLVLIDYQRDAAIASVLWLCCFPMAFFFISHYAEALFLMLSILGAYYARRGQFIASGAAIALAGATRSTAFLLAVLFFFEFWQQRNFKQSQSMRMGSGALIAPLGVLGYYVFLLIISNNTNVLSSYLSNQHTEWQRYIVWPWITLYDAINAVVLGNGINSDWFSRVIAWQDLVYALFGMACAILGLFRVRLSYALFFLTSMIFIYAIHGPYGYAFWSIPRYVASLFPMYIVLSLVTIKLPKYLQWFLITTSTSLLGILSAWFTSGRWVA